MAHEGTNPIRYTNESAPKLRNRLGDLVPCLFVVILICMPVVGVFFGTGLIAALLGVALGVDSWRDAYGGGMMMLLISWPLAFIIPARTSKGWSRIESRVRGYPNACAIVSGVAVLGLLVAHFVWDLPWPRSAIAGIVVPIGTVIAGYLLILAIVLVLMAFSILIGALLQLTPSARRERRIYREVRSMTIAEALNAAERHITDGAFTVATCESDNRKPLPEDTPFDVVALLEHRSEIRSRSTDELLARYDGIALDDFLGQRVLRLQEERGGGPIIVMPFEDSRDEGATSAELFEDVNTLMKGVPWGTGFPSLSHYLVYVARTDSHPSKPVEWNRPR